MTTPENNALAEVEEDSSIASSLRGALKTELRRILRPPYSVLTCIAVNGLLVTLLWFIAPTWLHDLFFSWDSTYFFPIVLASWMIADVPATNQLAPDRYRVLSSLDNAEAIARLLRAKHLAIALICIPITVTAAIVVGVVTGAWVTMVLTVVWVSAVPLSSIGIACIVGVLWPYHELPLKTRWQLRSKWRTIFLRWGFLILLPYGLVPALGLVGMAPSLLIWWAAKAFGQSGEALDVAFLAGLLIATPLALLVWRRASSYAARLAVRRSTFLIEYLNDPLLG